MQPQVALGANRPALVNLAQREVLEVGSRWASHKLVALAKDSSRTIIVSSEHQSYQQVVCLDLPKINKRIINKTTDFLMLEAQERNADK